MNVLLRVNHHPFALIWTSTLQKMVPGELLGLGYSILIGFSPIRNLD